MEVSQKTENRTTSNSNPGYRSEENENTNSKRYMHPNVHSSIIYSSQDMKQSTMDDWIKKMWCIYTQWIII